MEKKKMKAESMKTEVGGEFTATHAAKHTACDTELYRESAIAIYLFAERIQIVHQEVSIS